MYASVVVVEGINLTNGWSNDTLSFNFQGKKRPDLFATQKKEWWFDEFGRVVHVRPDSSKKNKKQSPKMAIGWPPEIKRNRALDQRTRKTTMPPNK